MIHALTNLNAALVVVVVIAVVAAVAVISVSGLPSLVEQPFSASPQPTSTTEPSATPQPTLTFKPLWDATGFVLFSLK